MKKYIKLIVYAVVGICLAVSITFAITTHRHNRTLKRQVTHQQEVIDSLLARRMKVVDVSLNVTDQSKSTIYGRRNMGSIIMPTERKYILEIDSTSVAIH